MTNKGTLALEMLEQVESTHGIGTGIGGRQGNALDAIIVPTSGGGMLGGIAKAVAPSGVQVFAVEPKGKVCFAFGICAFGICAFDVW